MQLDAGERVGLIGRNGTGKSSLMHVLAGRDKLDDGILTRQDGLVSNKTRTFPKPLLCEKVCSHAAVLKTLPTNVKSGQPSLVSMNACIACARQANKIPKPLRAVKRKKRRLP